MNFRKLNLFYILAIVLGLLIIVYIFHRASIREGAGETTDAAADEVETDEDATDEVATDEATPDEATADDATSLLPRKDATPLVGVAVTPPTGAAASPLVGAAVTPPTGAEATPPPPTTATPPPTTGDSGYNIVQQPNGARSDTAIMSDSSASVIYSSAKDTTTTIKFGSIDQQIQTAVSMIGKIYGRIPVSIADVIPGSISAIPYEAAIKQGGANIKINVVPKLDKNKKQVFYAINSTGAPVLFDSSSMRLSSNDAVILGKSTCTPSSSSASSSSKSGCSTAYSIVFPACQWVIDMRLPIGPRGDQGDKGPVGDVGRSGTVGEKGEYGFIGNWGKP